MGKYQSWACAEGSNLVRTVAVLVQKGQIQCIAGLVQKDNIQCIAGLVDKSQIKRPAPNLLEVLRDPKY